ncbi:hypothetical protein BLD48_13345 [Exiguobacterium sp. KRL4]|uniref:hypothetical protein n=1 Tax=Exiguobacterium sp. KRL4 TaxID=1914536 RepID=UPI0008F82D84|nr:hypothetical protein [Exiguobacterium sp. KRL4]OIN65915.1 hypothetical protein BLD48_13345 [Exiguobacterium sp. KRL4]
MDVLVLFIGSCLLSGLMLLTIVQAVFSAYRKQTISLSKAIVVTLGMAGFSMLLAGVLPYLYLRFM